MATSEIVDCRWCFSGACVTCSCDLGVDQGGGGGGGGVTQTLHVPFVAVQSKVTGVQQ